MISNFVNASIAQQTDANQATVVLQACRHAFQWLNSVISLGHKIMEYVDDVKLCEFAGRVIETFVKGNNLMSIFLKISWYKEKKLI